MPIYGVSTRALKDFLTTEREQLRKFTKIPSVEFRMWEIDIDPEERKQNSEGKPQESSDEFDDVENGYYDDFVIIER